MKIKKITFGGIDITEMKLNSFQLRPSSELKPRYVRTGVFVQNIAVVTNSDIPEDKILFIPADKV